MLSKLDALRTYLGRDAKLAPFAGKLVTVTGKQLEKDGMRIIDMESVEAAAK